MNEGMAQFERFLVAMPCIIVCAICGLLIVQKMIVAELGAVVGFPSLAVLIAIMWFCVSPPHPLVPVIAIIGLVALMASFPFAEKELERREQREYDMERLERAYNALAQKPDNPSAAFEIARWLRVHGFFRDAIAIAELALNALSNQRDDVRNMSLRDAFRREDYELTQWKREPIPPEPAQAHRCPACSAQNDIGMLLCKGCGRPYLLDKVRLSRMGDKVFAKLIATYVLVAGLFVAGACIGLSLEGTARYVALGVALLFVGLVLAWLFRPPVAAKA